MKQRTGLGRKVSSIFDGVPVPGATNNAFDDSAAVAELPRQLDYPKTEPDEYVKSESKQATKFGNSPVYSRIAEVAKKNIEKEALADTKRKKIATVLACVLSVIFIFTIWNAFKTPATVRQPMPEKKVSAPVIDRKPAPKDAIAISWKEPDALPSAMRDPMQVVPVTNAAPGQPQPVSINVVVVKGIVFSADKPAAIVNNKIVYQGQAVDGVTVSKINKDSIEFASQGKTWSQTVER
jgi:hypothetical protein